MSLIHRKNGYCVQQILVYIDSDVLLSYQVTGARSLSSVILMHCEYLQNTYPSASPDETKYSLCSFRDTTKKKPIFHLGELIELDKNSLYYSIANSMIADTSA